MSTRPFYLYTGLHAFLIGLFPFYLPVYLYSSGMGMSRICLFVAATGAGYCLTLYLFDRLRTRLTPTSFISFSFMSELLLLAIVFWQGSSVAVIPTGLVNGVFACIFWTVQRLLFVSSVHSGNSGNHFGNAQLLVMLSMKAAILLGGLLLEHGRENAVLLCSSILVASAVAIFMTRPVAATMSREFSSAPPLSLKSVLRFNDNLHSRPVFIIDGVFLYLESYFWLISMFIVFREDVSSLGLATVILGLLFGTIYLAIKTTIDRYADQPLYRLTVMLYLFSWLLRAYIDEIDNQAAMMTTLAVIAFCTSLFRLSFNKRFFDNAKLSIACHHIVVKSYISQFFLSIFFLLGAVFFAQPFSEGQQLTPAYLTAALLTPVFLLYRKKRGVLSEPSAVSFCQTAMDSDAMNSENPYDRTLATTPGGRTTSRQRRTR
jgi:hypothetical protein